MDVLWKNLVYSARMLWKRPSLTAVAVIAIGLGIGANTAIFSVVNTVLLQPLPYPQPKQLVMVSSEQRNQALDGRGAFSVPDFLDVQKSSTTLEYVAIHQGTGTITTGGKIVETRKDGKVVSRAIEGGDSRRVSRGDFVMIPEGVPHYVTEASPELVFMAIEFPRPRAAQMPPAPTN